MYRGPIVDVDVHHTWSSDRDLLEYLPAGRAEFLSSFFAARPYVKAAQANHISPGANGSNKRLDSVPRDGGPPGSDSGWMAEQLLDPMDIRHAVLCYDIGWQSGFPNPYLAVELCRAANDWSLDHWLDGRDERLHGAILVPTELPDEAAKEIRRLAGRPEMVEVLLVANMLGKPFGHPIYSPIFEAAAEVGLPVAIHLGGEAFVTGSTRTAAAGAPMSRLELFATFDQGGMHHTASLFTHGVFERHPGLKVVLKEHGFTWLPWLIWRLDAQYPLMRRECPHVSRLASELVRERMIVSTQPFDHGTDREQMRRLLDSFEPFEDVLVFASDYPHWDTDEPRRVAARLPSEWHRKVFYDNAARFFGFEGAPLADGAAVG